MSFATEAEVPRIVKTESVSKANSNKYIYFLGGHYE